MQRALTGLALGLGLALLSGCGGSDADESTGSSGTVASNAEVGRYEQTWEASYDRTTCDEWLQDMDEHQRYVAGTDMLLGAAQSEDPHADMPPDDKIAEFQRQLDTACSGEGSMTLSDAGAALVMIDPSLYDY